MEAMIQVSRIIWKKTATKADRDWCRFHLQLRRGRDVVPVGKRGYMAIGYNKVAEWLVV
jgi:hypothetical protein